jgi:hypothetical protein
MKFSQYRFEYFSSSHSGTWCFAAEFRKAREINGLPWKSVKSSPVPTVVLLFILSLYGSAR